MTNNNQFYRTREAEARREAEAATLDNARDRQLHAAEAWAALANRGEKTAVRRAEEEARKAAAAQDEAGDDTPAAPAG